MKIINDFQQGSEAWMEFKKGKISGSRVKDILPSKTATKTEIIEKLIEYKVDHNKKSTVGELQELLPREARKELFKKAEKKLEFYQLIADRIAIQPDQEDRMERGLRLEEEAAELFSKKYKVKLEVNGCWQSDDNEKIIISPDRVFKNDPTKAVEIKCLSSARHLQASLEDRLPPEFETQVIQYFVVNERLETLYVVFFDPRVVYLPLHVIKITRDELGDSPETYKEYESYILEEIDEIVEKLTF